MSELPEAIPEFVALGLAFVSLCVIALLVRSRRRVTALTAERNAALAARDAVLGERDVALHERDGARSETQQINSGRTALLEETQHLISVRMPALVTHLAHQHVAVPGLKHQPFAGTEVEQLHRSALEQLSQAIAAERERVDEAAQAVMRGATTVIQAQSYQLQSKVEAMQHRYDTPDLAQDLLELDLLNEQNLRRIQATGVLCGASPGLTRVDSHLGDVVVGAQSRVRGYRRIEVTSQLDAPVAVVARAVEPVAITVSELLANAVHHSHGTLAVDVSLHQAESGAVIVIDDAGVGMHADEIEFATRMLAGRDSLRLSELGDPPRSGFATIGRLVRQYGFSVSVDKPAPYGGVRAVVLIPGHLLTLLDEEERPMSVMAPMAPSASRQPQPYASDAATYPSAEVAGTDRDAAELLPVADERQAVAAEEPVAEEPVEEEPVAEPEPEAAAEPEADDEDVRQYAADQAAPPAPAEAEPAPVAPEPAERLGGIEGLPRRRRRRPQADESAEARYAPDNQAERAGERVAERAVDTGLPAAAEVAPEQHTSPEETQAAWSAFQAGTESGRAAAHTDEPREGS